MISGGNLKRLFSVVGLLIRLLPFNSITFVNTATRAYLGSVTGRRATSRSTLCDWRFHTIMTDSSTDKTDALFRRFMRFDTNGDGLVDENEFRKIIQELGGNSTDEVLSLEFAAIDTNTDGMVGYQEFKNWWLDYK